MSTRTLHATIVRMLSDARFREAVYLDPDAALPELPAEARAWLRAPDPRAWDIDPHRNARLLAALLDEFRVSALALAALGWRTPRLHAFFGSPEFHGAIAAWGSLFFAFPAWLLGSLSGRASAAARAMVQLEAALARVQRADLAPAPLRPGHVAPGRGVVALVLPAGALETWQRHDAAATPSRVASLLGASPSVLHNRVFDAARLHRSRQEALLLTPGPAGPEIAVIGDGLARTLLAISEGGAPPEVFIAAAVAEGLERADAEGLLSELLGDGTVIAAS